MGVRDVRGRLGFVGVAVCTVLLALGCASGGPDMGGPKKPKGPTATVVELADVAKGEVAEVLSTTALVESEHTARVSPTASGIVVEVHAEAGDTVRRGQLLAVIENVSLDAGAERAREEVARLERDLDQVRSLHAAGAASDRELETAQDAAAAARTALREASRTLGQTRLVAPFDGVVASRGARIGELLSPGSAAFEVVDPTTLRVRATLPERDLTRVDVGDPVALTSAYDAAITATGHVARVAPVVDPNTGTFEVTIAVDPPAADAPTLRPGQFVGVGVEVDRHRDVLVVPRQAVVWEEGVATVYRMVPKKPEADTDAPDKAPEAPKASWWPFGGDAAANDADTDAPEAPGFVAERVTPKLGLDDGARAEVLGGLAEGDDVIVVGQSNLREGAPVETAAMRAERKAAAKASDTDAKKDG